ncbi:MAG: AAA family ATPase, partial [Acidimicrobiaceae bacterium]|nr:AAA family ATPase [Acidimicrobiaceae bacterium]
PVESWLRGWLLKKSGLDQYQNSSEPLSVDMSARQESLLLASSDDIRGAFETVYNLGSVDPSYRVKIIHDRVLRYSLDDMARLALSMIELGGLYFEDNPYHDKDDSDSWYVNPERLLMTDFTKIAHQLVSAIVDDEWTRDPSLRQWADSAVAERQRPAVANMLRDHVRYLGPLRQEPRPFFDIDDEDRLDVGAAGQHLARVLQWHGTRTVDVPELGKVDLVDGLQRWLRKLGVIDEVAVEARGRAGVSVEVRPPDLDRRVDLTSVGVGISQVLPVLVVCLLADPGDLVLLEQPELHLHPALQMRLADFLLACVESGRQIIVETHSENLVNRLRRRVAEDDTSDTAGLVRVVFAERNAEGHTTFRPSDINPLGGLSQDWPDGFLDLGARDAQKLLRAGLAKHRRLKSA